MWGGGSVHLDSSPTDSLSLFCLQFSSPCYYYLIKYFKTKEKQSRSFILCFAHLITDLTHHGQTHTNAQMSPAGGTFQNIWRDKKWWKAPRSNKRKVALVEWELFGLWKKVMKHLKRKNVKPNLRICGQRRNTWIIKPAHWSAKSPSIAMPHG